MMYFTGVVGIRLCWRPDGLISSAFLILFLWLVAVPAGAQGEQSSTAGSQPKNLVEEQQKAMETFYKLDQSNNYTESMTYADMNVLPMGIRRTAGNVEVTIAVSEVVWLTTHSELTLYARIKLPEADSKPLFFGAKGIKFSYNGDIVGDAMLALFGDVSIPIQGNTAALTLKGGFDGKTGQVKDLTYVSVDCQGFREMGITADVEFSEGMMSPVDATGNKTPGRVKGRFSTVVKSWNDILINISLPPFELKGLDKFVFTMQEAVFDFSDSRNDEKIVYPEGYESNYMISGNPTLWRGVYIRKLSVTMPPQFARREGKERVSFAAEHMLLDNNGVSGSFGVKGVLPIKDGSASGWRFSVDEFKLDLEANRLIGANFSGQIGLPIAEKTTVGYDALITADNEYQLRIKTLGTTKFDVFHAEAELLPNSYVVMKVVDGKFRPEAMLHGNLNLAARMGSDTTSKKLAEFKGIEFRSLHLKTEAPRFTAEYFGYKGELKLMNFPISIDKIGVRILENEVALGMTIKLTLSDNMFTGSTGLEFVGKYKENTTTGADGTPQTGSGKWQYDGCRINSIAINAEIAETFVLKAELIIMHDDPVYGNGYAGSLDMTFKKVLSGMNIRARAMFGKTEFRYWFVDGRIKFPGGLPVFPPVNLSGFGGGVYYRMKRDVANSTSSEGTDGVYIPDENTALGVRAAVLFSVASDAVINGEASFEIAFSRSGGLNFIGFYGFAKFVGKIPGTENIESFVKDKQKLVAEKTEKLIKGSGALQALEKLKQFEPNKAAESIFQPTSKPGEDGGFAAAVGIQYDFTQKSLHATFDLYINVLGGILKGTASKNRAGWAVLHIDPKEWYAHMGTPTDKLGIRLGIGGVSLETGSYLMVGQRIPGSPPPPQEVADILGVDMEELDYMRDLNALGDGRGFAFGMNLKIQTGDMSFLMLYANFACGIGFDIMLKDYGPMECKGRSGAIGIDGWYANGQSYVYLQGELGVRVNLWFLKTKIPIIKGAAAVLMQAQLPNPVFIRGYLAVTFELLGGLVSGDCRFKVVIGEQCELVVPGSSPIETAMISDMTPRENAGDVDVFAAPQAAFNMRVGVPFEVQDDEGAKTFRIQVTEFTVKDEAQQEIVGKLVWSQKKDNVSFYSHEVLPPSKKLKAEIKVGFERYQNGQWSTVYTSGQKAQEIKAVSFTTGTAPDIIPMTNVDFSYPVVDQRYFLKDESRNGYIQLKRGQSYLFSPEYTHRVHITGADGTAAMSFTYSTSNNRIAYTLPEIALKSQYAVDVVTLTDGESTEAQVVATQVGSGDDKITVTNNQAGSTVRSDVGKSLLNYSFATSSYATFEQKVRDIRKGPSEIEALSSDVLIMHYQITGGEPFEMAELKGTTFTAEKPLVRPSAKLTDDYYREDIHPFIYERYPVEDIKLTREGDILGVPPVRAINISTKYLTEIENDNFLGAAKQYFPYIYYVPQIYKEDYIDLQRKIVNRFMGTPQAKQYGYIINNSYRLIRTGYYVVNFQYVLPDGTPGTNGDFTYYNFIK
jgi:hypothetical protein